MWVSLSLVFHCLVIVNSHKFKVMGVNGYSRLCIETAICDVNNVYGQRCSGEIGKFSIEEKFVSQYQKPAELKIQNCLLKDFPTPEEKLIKEETLFMLINYL